jgi:hypothetical protein
VNKFTKIVGYTVAAIGFAYVVKHIKHSIERMRGWHKIKVEDEKPTENVEQKIKEEDERRTGSRYGSNPIRY